MGAGAGDGARPSTRKKGSNILDAPMSWGRSLMVAASIFGKRLMSRHLIGQGLAKT